MSLGLPEVKLTFSAAIARAFSPGADGRMALIVRDAAQTTGAKIYEITSPDGLAEAGVTAAAATTEAIRQAFLGGITSLVVVLLATLGEMSAAYDLVETARFDVCAVADIASGEVAGFVAWAKGLYDTDAKHALFVVAEATAPDHPAIVNFVADDILAADPDDPTTPMAVTQEKFVPRIAGAIAGAKLWEGVTFLKLGDVVSCAAMTKTNINAAIAAGKLALYYNGETVKIARGVTSLETPTTTYPTPYQKIKIVRTLNRIEDDIVRNIEDNWLGRVPNTVENKHLLVSAILDYLQQMEKLSVLQPGTSTMAIDVVKTRTYLKTIRTAAVVDAMTDEQVLEEDSGDKLYLAGSIRPVDSVEDIDIAINL